MKIEHVLIVGLGHIAERYIKLIRLLDARINISGVSRRHDLPQRITKNIDPIYNDLAEVPFNTLDLAILCSAASDHIKDARVLMQNKVNILIEKPLSHNVDGLDFFIKEQAESGTNITVGYVLRHRPDLKYFFDLIQEINPGSIKKVEVVASSYLPDWRPGRDYRTSVSADPEKGGGVLLELSHELDYVNWIFGPIVRVSCQLSNTGILGIAVEEQAKLTLTNENGVPIEIHLDFISRESTRFCRVITDKEIYVCNFIDKTVGVFRIKNNTAEERLLYKEFQFDFELVYLNQLKEFISAIETGKRPLVKLSEAAHVIKIIQKARESDRLNKAIAISYQGTE